MMTRRWLRAALWASLLAAGSADASAAEVSVGGGVAHPGRYATNGGKGLIALLLEAGVKLADFVKALNSLGATPQDLLAILQAMKASGALRAELEII